ncbi:MAG: hypothetical protein VKI81_09125 [Synechococcaceae cyanobacterium]|nr:hypothetical protein [Synechococcaceae cyanobacterium]
MDPIARFTSMASPSPTWPSLLAKRGPSPALALLLSLFIVLVPVLLIADPAHADRTDQPRTYRCDGESLIATLHHGAVDDPSIPNASRGTLPGAFVQLQWRDVNLQLPRTNNAGAPSFTDGKWWWSLEDGEHPRFRLRRGLGDGQDFACEPVDPAGKAAEGA